MPKVQYRIYVIELSKRVFNENTKFRNANPQFNGALQCLYVGMTSKTPRERFKQHKTCLLYTSPSPRDKRQSRMPSSA